MNSVYLSLINLCVHHLFLVHFQFLLLFGLLLSVSGVHTQCEWAWYCLSGCTYTIYIYLIVTIKKRVLILANIGDLVITAKFVPAIEKLCRQ